MLSSDDPFVALAVNTVPMVPVPSRFVFAVEIATAEWRGAWAKIGVAVTAIGQVLQRQNCQFETAVYEVVSVMPSVARAVTASGSSSKVSMNAVAETALDTDA